jgi:hypothetical protein
MSKVPAKAILWTLIGGGQFLTVRHEARVTVTDWFLIGGSCIIAVWEWVEAAQRHRISRHGGPRPPAA